MPPRLGQDSFARIDKQDRQLDIRRRRHHVARVLLVPRRICNDELAPISRKETVRNVDGDSLLALCRKPVDQSDKSSSPGGTFRLRDSASSAAS